MHFPIRILSCCFLTIIFAGCGGGPQGELKEGKSKVDALPDSITPVANDTESWMTWRGPNRNGITVDQNPPTQWTETENILWKTEVPGRGHSSPTIVNGKIFLTTADRSAQTQSLICIDQASGKVLWNKDVHSGGLTSRIHPSNSHASPSVASDGSHVFCVFINNGQTILSKYDFSGEQVWQKQLGKFQCDYGFGFGASPIFWGNKIIVSSECSADPFIVALNPDSGDQIWKIERPANTSFSTPVVANVAGKDQLLVSGSQNLMSYDPNTGNELWSVPAKWKVTCGTVVWTDDMVFASGGFPAPQTIAVKADGSAQLVWENTKKCYEQSMLAHDGHIYGLIDTGICYCWEAATGKVKWKQRMKPKVSASPTLAGGHIYFVTEDGTCFVIKANPEKYEEVSKVQMGNSAFATPSFVGNKIYLRYAKSVDGERQEYLVCIGAK